MWRGVGGSGSSSGTALSSKSGMSTGLCRAFLAPLERCACLAGEDHGYVLQGAGSWTWATTGSARLSGWLGRDPGKALKLLESLGRSLQAWEDLILQTCGLHICASMNYCGREAGTFGGLEHTVHPRGTMSVRGRWGWGWRAICLNHLRHPSNKTKGRATWFLEAPGMLQSVRAAVSVALAVVVAVVVGAHQSNLKMYK